MYRHRHAGSRSLFSIAGWLFADLLLALAVIFISANTLGTRPVRVVKPATPIPITVTPQITPILELHHQRLILYITDPKKLIGDDTNTIEQLKQQVIAEPVLQGRLAGLVIVYGGAPTTSQIHNAVLIAKKVMVALQSLTSDNYSVFSNTSYYDPLYLLGGKNTIVTIDVYLFAR